MSESRRIEFPGSQGAPLAARLELPDGEPRGYALFAHCFTCGKDSAAASRISRALSLHGIAVLRFDFTGLGQSGGDFTNTGFSSNIEDLVRAADCLRADFAAPALLIGHSLGGAAVLAAAHRIPETRAVATIGAPADPGHVLQLLEPYRERPSGLGTGPDSDLESELETRGEATVELAGRRFRIGRAFLDDITAQLQQERIRELGAALLVMHSPVDQVVGVENARQIFEAARHPKSFIALDGADHLLSSRDDTEFAATMLAAWAARYLPAPAASSSPELVAVAEAVAEEVAEAGAGAVAAPGAQGVGGPGVVTVAEKDAGGLAQTVTAGRHTLMVDEPVPLGADTGPNPYDLLLAALGACTSMTVRMYASRKQWPLEKVTVSLRHTRVHATDCAECETTEGTISQIDRVIRLDGPLDAEQRERLLEIADKCPVHRTLTSEMAIRTIAAP